jgi:hypothetical protein
MTDTVTAQLSLRAEVEQRPEVALASSADEDFVRAATVAALSTPTAMAEPPACVLLDSWISRESTGA